MGSVRNIRVADEGGFHPLAPHFMVRQNNPNVVVHGDDHTGLKSSVTFNYERIVEMLSHHMGNFETGGGNLLIDGFQVPVKVVARVYIDAIVSLLGNHGVATNLSAVRNGLCPGCIGSSAPAREFVNNEPLTPDGVAHSDTQA